MHLISSHMNFSNKNKIWVQGPPKSSHATVITHFLIHQKW